MATYLQSHPGIYKITSISKGSMSRKLLGKRINKTTFKYI